MFRKSIISQMSLVMIAVLTVLAPLSTGYAHPSDGTSIYTLDGASSESESIESFVDQYVADGMQAAHVPGFAVVVVKDGKTLISKGYGYADLEQRIPMTPQTNLRAGSVSKPVVATAVMQLVDQGLVELDAPISRYIPDLELTDRFGQASTVAQLLTHQSGYTDADLLSHAPTLEEWQPLGEYLHDNLGPRDIQPGVMAYSSRNTALLGYMIEKITGLPYDQAIARSLFDPLGMSKTTFTQPLPDEIRANLATGYFYQGGTYEIVPLDYVRSSPGIAMVTTAEDMGRLMQSLLNGGQFNGMQVLKAETTETLLTRQAAAHTYSRGKSYAFSENRLGGRQVLNHDGNGIGFGSRMILVPEHDLGIFISTNHRQTQFDANTQTPAFVFIRDLASAILEREVPETPQNISALTPLPDAAERAGRYAGHYQLAGSPLKDFFKIRLLLDNVDVSDNGDGSITIGSKSYVEVEPLVFQRQDNASSFVVFIENARGEVEYLTFGGTGSYKKAGWYQTLNFTIGLVAGMLLIFLSYIVTWPFLRQGSWLAWAISLLNLIFLVGFGIMIATADIVLFFKMIPLPMRLLMALPWISALGTLGLLVSQFRRSSRQGTSRWGQIHTSLMTIASLAFLWFVAYWNLLLR